MGELENTVKEEKLYIDKGFEALVREYERLIYNHILGETNIDRLTRGVNEYIRGVTP